MTDRSRFSAPSPTLAEASAWMHDLAIRLLAHTLNMPAPLVHTTGVYVVAQVQAAEHRAAKTLCPFTWLRRALARRRRRMS
jgi:hypothetical protein